MGKKVLRTWMFYTYVLDLFQNVWGYFKTGLIDPCHLERYP